MTEAPAFILRWLTRLLGAVFVVCAALLVIGIAGMAMAAYLDSLASPVPDPAHGRLTGLESHGATVFLSATEARRYHLGIGVAMFCIPVAMLGAVVALVYRLLPQPPLETDIVN